MLHLRAEFNFFADSIGELLVELFKLHAQHLICDAERIVFGFHARIKPVGVGIELDHISNLALQSCQLLLGACLVLLFFFAQLSVVY